MCAIWFVSDATVLVGGENISHKVIGRAPIHHVTGTEREKGVGDPVPEKTIGKRPWVPVGGPRGVGRIVGVLSRELCVNRGSREVVVLPLS
jgi:hypothetical protein